MQCSHNLSVTEIRGSVRSFTITRTQGVISKNGKTLLCMLLCIFGPQVSALLTTTYALLVQLCIIQDVLVNVSPRSVVVNFGGISVCFLSFLRMNV